MKKAFPAEIILIILFLLCGIALIRTGVWERDLINTAVPRFTGEGLDYGTDRLEWGANVIFTVQIAALAGLILQGIFSKKHKGAAKILGTAGTAAGTVYILFCAFIFTGLTETFADSYLPGYYEVSDRDNSVRLLFEEGQFLLDAHIRVYLLDENDNAFYMGSFSADDGMLRGGRYDVVRKGNRIFFEYNYGTHDKNGKPVIKGTEMSLPF